MDLLLRLIKSIARGVGGLIVFIVIVFAWTGILYWINPWSDAKPGEWPGYQPIAVSSDTQETRVIPYRQLADEMKNDPLLRPRPGTPDGSFTHQGKHTSWKTAREKAWQYEVRWHDRDHTRDSRYRLDGDVPVLIEVRDRGPAIAFQGIILAILTLIVWKCIAWWRRRQP